jgi:hypothetical protein
MRRVGSKRVRVDAKCLFYYLDDLASSDCVLSVVTSAWLAQVNTWLRSVSEGSVGERSVLGVRTRASSSLLM